MIIDAVAVTEIISVAKCIITEAQSFIYGEKTNCQWSAVL